MTVDAVRAGLTVGEIELPLRHRATGKDPGGFAHRSPQLADAVLAAGPLAVNHRGNRLPLVGWIVPLASVGLSPAAALPIAGVAAVGLADDLWSGPERGWRGHLSAGRTTGILKLVAIPALGLLATRTLEGALLVGLCANALNQLDTKPGRALKMFLLSSLALRDVGAGRFAEVAVLLLPYDLRERGMLGDAGSNALGAVVGLSLVARLTARGRWTAVGIMAALNVLGDVVSLGALIERTPVVAALDRAGRVGA